MGGTVTAGNRRDRLGAAFTRDASGPGTDDAREIARMSPTILVIDDEPPIRKLLRMGLSTQGYAILEAPNAPTALEDLSAKARTSSSSTSACPTCAGTTCSGRSA